MTLGDRSFQIKAAEADRGRAFRKYLRPATSPRQVIAVISGEVLLVGNRWQRISVRP